MSDEDRKIIADLFLSHYDYLYKRCVKKINDVHSAHYIVQNVFVVACREHEKFLAHPKPFLWMNRMLSNLIKQWYQERSSYNKLFVPYDENLEAVQSIGNPEPLFPSDRWSKEEINEIIEIILKKFRPAYRDLFREHFLKKRPISEIAAEHNTTVNAVRIRAIRVRAKFEIELKIYLDNN